MKGLLCIFLIYVVVVICAMWFLGEKYDNYFKKAQLQVQSFLEETDGVVKVESVKWQGIAGWCHEVSSVKSGKIMLGKPANEKNPNPGEFWKAKLPDDKYLGVVL